MKTEKEICQERLQELKADLALLETQRKEIQKLNIVSSNPVIEVMDTMIEFANELINEEEFEIERRC